MKAPELDTYQKALTINMDKSPYGTIAEIGAGQETSRWFFKAGGAAATIAKTMSAYDMKFSDSIYGPCKRYVSRERLQAMLNKEYTLLLERLDEMRGSECSFFSFANTVSTYSHAQKSAGHGWLGICFQTHPTQAASQIHLHVVLKGTSSVQDQETLGILGVNLIYAAYYQHEEPEVLLTSLIDGLNSELLEIDMVDFQGPAFKSVDNRLMALHLVKFGLSHAAIFNASGKLVQPSEELYKKSVLVERNLFRPPTLLTLNILDCAYESFVEQENVDPENVVVLSEMTLQNLRDHESGELEDDIDINDFLQRVDMLCALGKNVMISNFGEFYKLAQYLFCQTNMSVAIALGIPNLINIFDEKYYENLEGGILESFGLLFRNDMRLYVAPMIDKNTDQLVTIHNLQIDKHLRLLFGYLIENKYLRDLEKIDRNYLLLNATDILNKIRLNDISWVDMVPDKVASIINERGLFQQ